MTIPIRSKLNSLRSLLSKHHLAAYLVPTSDPHQSEYVAAHHARREWISGFTGSAGTAMIFQWEKLNPVHHESQEEAPGAFLWTDSRYTLQAKQELSDELWNVMIYPKPQMNYPQWFEKNGQRLADWIRKKYDVEDSPLKIGIDPQLVTVKEFRGLEKRLKSSGFELVFVDQNLVDEVWEAKAEEDPDEKRPSRPEEPIRVLDESYAGVSVEKKLADLRAIMKEKGCKYLVTGMLDEIAWLLNLRGCDISYNPVFLAFALVSLDDVVLFSDGDRYQNSKVKAHLDKLNIQLKSYNSFVQHLEELHFGKDGKIWIAPEKINMATYHAASRSDNSHIFESDSQIEKLKAIKNETEIEGFRKSNIRDGAALVKFYSWLEQELQNGNTNITEVSAAKKLLWFRQQQPLFVSESFPPIVGYGENGAVVHYHAREGKCATIGTDKMLLIDSGAQYMDGTTDTTRTVHFGTPTDEERDSFTRVLKGHIAMDQFVFPDGSLSGFQLDVVARQFLWQKGLDYGHGTGHLIGHFLNVHEGPAYIGFKNKERGLLLLEKGMVCSNEPGYYEEGKYGIRIESDVVVKKVDTDHRFNDVDYLGFEHFTMVPLQTKLISMELMTKFEVEWVNAYNKKVLERVAPLLKDNEAALKYLERECAPIQ